MLRVVIPTRYYHPTPPQGDNVNQATTTAPCELHKYHTPVPSYCELHHVIPQAWQFIWAPPGFAPMLNRYPNADFPSAGPSPDHPGSWLWDNRTVSICRTGHGNVHHWLVYIMQLMANGNFNLLGAAAKLRHDVSHVGRTDLETAQLAIRRFELAGGDLKTLWDKKQWGAI